MIRKRNPQHLRLGLSVVAYTAIGALSTQAAFDVRLYQDIPGDALQDIQPTLEDPDFPDSPDLVDFHYSAPGFFTDERTSVATSGFFEWPQEPGVAPRSDSGFDFYGGAASGLLYVPEDGNYRFYVASNNESGLFFNPEGSEFLDPTADGVEPIAFEDDLSESYELNPAAAETSQEFFLEAGKGYAIEMIWAERTGQDWFQVGWSVNGGAVSTIPAFFIQRDVRYGRPSAEGITSLEGDVAPFGAEGDPLVGAIGVSFEKAAEDHADTSIRWVVDPGDGLLPIEDVMSEGELARISGLNAPALNISALSPLWDGYIFRAIVDGALGPEIELEVDVDEDSPKLGAVRGVAFPSAILVEFSEPVDLAAATDPANYQFSPDKSILNIEAQPDERSVRIDIGPFTNEPLQLTVSGIPDLSFAQNELEETTVNVNLNPFGVLALWEFDGSTDDSIGRLNGVLESGASLSNDSPFEGGQSLDLGDTSESQLLRVSKAGEMLNEAAAGDSITFSYWQKHDAVVNSTAFWALSPSSSSGGRGAQAHSPWSNGFLFFHTAGCCSGTTQQIFASINDLGDPSFSFLDWHHYAFVKEGTTKSMWVDGQLLKEGVNTLPLPSDFTELAIGADASGLNSSQGMIDDFAIFAGALDPEVIAAIANQSVSPEAALEPRFGELSIGDDLSDVVVTENEIATFTFTPEGTPVDQVAHVWTRNGEEVPGINGNVLSIPVTLEDDGSTISVRAANANGAFNEIQSSEALLTVLPDTEAPEILDVEGSPLNDRLKITFSEAMATGPLANPANYSVAPADGGNAIATISATPASDGLSVRIVLESAMIGGALYTLNSENLTDIAASPNPLGDPTATTISYELASGGLTALLYPSFPGPLLLSLGEAPPGEYPDGFAPFGIGANASLIAAGFSSSTPYFESPASGDINQFPPSVRNSYAQIVFGYIRPPETADYRFFLASDDEGQLWLSTSENPADARLIASEPVWNRVREYDDGEKEDNWSDPVSLEAGQLYYVEARMSEGDGGEALAVAWTSSTDGSVPPVPENGALPIPGEFLFSNFPVEEDVVIASSLPAQDGTGVLVDAGELSVVLRNGFTDRLDPDSVTIAVNGEPVASSVSAGDAGDYLVSGSMPLLPLNSTIPVVINYETIAGEAKQIEYGFQTEDIPVLPAGWAVGLDEGTEMGIPVRVVQAAVDAGRANTRAAAEAQLQDGIPPSILQGEGVFDVVNFNEAVDDGSGGAGLFRGASPTSAFQIQDTNLNAAGLIGSVHTDQWAMEANTYVAFPESRVYTMGVNVDDGFALSTGFDNTPEEATLTLGEHNGSGTAINDGDKFVFRFAIEEPGIYPMRLIGWEGTGDSSIEWYAGVDADRRLIGSEEGLLAYQGRSREPIGEVGSISIAADGAGGVTVQYNGTLQSAPAIEGPYTDVEGASSPYTFTPEGNVFLRAQ